MVAMYWVMLSSAVNDSVRFSCGSVLLWFGRIKSPVGSWLWTLGPHLVTLLDNITEPVGGGTVMEEVWGLSLVPLPFPFLPLCFLCADEIWSLQTPGWPHTPASILLLPQWMVCPETVSPDKPFLSKVAFVRIFYHSNSKINNTCVFNSPVCTQEWNFWVIKKSQSLLKNSQTDFSTAALFHTPTRITEVCVFS